MNLDLRLFCRNIWFLIALIAQSFKACLFDTRLCFSIDDRYVSNRFFRFILCQRKCWSTCKRRYRKAFCNSAFYVLIDQILIAESYFKLIGMDIDVNHGNRHLNIQHANRIMTDGNAFTASILQRLRQQRAADGAAIDNKGLPCTI